MGEKLKASECQRRLGVSRSSIYRILAKERGPGIHRIYVPGSKKPMIRVDPSVIERILRRSSEP
jgi:transposase